MSKEWHNHPDKKRPNIDIKRITDHLEESQKIRKETEITQTEATWIPPLDYPHLPFAVVIASDIHYGSKGTDYQKLKKDFGIVYDTPNFFLATNGDHIDNFSPTVLSSGMLETPITPDMQIRAFVELMKNMDRKNKVAWMNLGNHDMWVTSSGHNPDTSLDEMEAPIFDTGGTINIVTRKGIKYRGVVAHQYWGKSKINITNAPKRLIEYEGKGGVDFGITGHTHQSAYEHFTKGGKELVAIVAGAYKIKDGWAKNRGISFGSGLPGITMVFWPDKKKIEVFKDIEEAQQFVLGYIWKDERKKG